MADSKSATSRGTENEVAFQRPCKRSLDSAVSRASGATQPSQPRHSARFIRTPASHMMSEAGKAPDKTMITALSESDYDQTEGPDLEDVDSVASFDDGLDLEDEMKPLVTEEDILDGDGYDTDVEVDIRVLIHGENEYDPSGRKDYVEKCQDLHVVPVSFYMRHIEDETLVLRHHGLGPTGAQAIAFSLEDNLQLRLLNLEGNGIEGEGACFLARALRDNTFLTELSLPENDLRTEGVTALCEMMKTNTNIIKLNLSGNNLFDGDAEIIHDMLQVNTSLKQLILRHNNFGEPASHWVREVLAHNEALELLDLSWNHFRTKGAVNICEGLKENIGLKYLYLEMNGFGVEGAIAMGAALHNNRCLLELDLSANRIPVEGAAHIAKGLQINDYLRILKIGRNPLLFTGAYALLEAIHKNDMSALELLNLEGVTVNEKFLDLQKKLREENREVEVVYEGVMASLATMYLVDEFDSTFQRDPMKLLRDYVDREGLRLIDLFKQFDKNNDFSLSEEEFRIGIKRCGIPINERQLKGLIRRLDTDGDGEIDFGELVAGDREYRLTRRKVKRANVATAEEYDNIMENDPDAVALVLSKHVKEWDQEKSAHDTLNKLGRFEESEKVKQA